MRGCLSGLALALLLVLLLLALGLLGSTWPPFRPVRKVHLIFWPNNGMHFPNGTGCGNCIPEFAFKTGHGFPNDTLPETVPHYSGEFRDVFSRWGISGKLRPVLERQNGIPFPETPLGKPRPGIRARNGSFSQTDLPRKLCPGIGIQTGTCFPGRAPREAVSRNLRPKRDALSRGAKTATRHSAKMVRLPPPRAHQDEVAVDWFPLRP